MASGQSTVSSAAPACPTDTAGPDSEVEPGHGEETAGTTEAMETAGPEEEGGGGVCSFFLMGKCRFGSRCRLSHSVPSSEDPGAVLPGEDSGKDEEEERKHKKKKGKVKTKAKLKDTEEKESKKKPRMRTADDVISRVLWDPWLEASGFVVGYVDRFLGVLERPFAEFNWDAGPCDCDYSAELALPRHRIQYFTYRGHRVWDRNSRTDRVFGSTGQSLAPPFGGEEEEGKDRRRLFSYPCAHTRVRTQDREPQDPPNPGQLGATQDGPLPVPRRAGQEGQEWDCSGDPDVEGRLQEMSIHASDSAPPAPGSSASFPARPRQEEFPRPAAEEEFPGPAAEEEFPGPAAEEEFPRSAAEEEFPRPAAEEEFPRSAAEEEFPRPAAKEEFPRSAAEEEFPRPAAEEEFPRPAAEEEFPRPAAEEEFPRPAAEEEFPRPAAEEEFPRSAAEEEFPRPAAEEEFPRPAAEEEFPRPAAEEEFPGPAAEEEFPRPAAEEEFPRSAAEEEFPRSAAEEEFPRPAAEEEFPRSAAEEEFPRPAAKEEFPRSAAEEEFPRPAAEEEFPRPAAEEEFPRPAAEEEFPRSAAEDAGNRLQSLTNQLSSPPAEGETGEEEGEEESWEDWQDAEKNPFYKPHKDRRPSAPLQQREEKRGGRPPKLSPTHFITFRANTPAILSGFQQLQEELTSLLPSSAPHWKPSSSLHITLCLLVLSGPAEVAAAGEILRRFAPLTATPPVAVSFPVRLKHFNGKVLYLSPQPGPPLQQLNSGLQEAYRKEGWLHRHSFNPRYHLTLAQVKEQGGDRVFEGVEALKVGKGLNLGRLPVNTLHLCGMGLAKTNGFYQTFCTVSLR
ncbi:LOW QUALITY PROTEIN: leukocyte receptor cluster member 9 [Lampris incognitus]|uniref:LOW QUALITY PROTEIN: leukocyte receptor cluster member 9 n=1 Tax=Lampris incognitus TaxID=2546036 RepID=UPI0024B48668|nr:LOW QUALITY PROTEIN: leukocyte receptor cluster member 9 [Lampris incognitus]